MNHVLHIAEGDFLFVDVSQDFRDESVLVLLHAVEEDIVDKQRVSISQGIGTFLIGHFLPHALRFAQLGFKLQEFLFVGFGGVVSATD